MYVGALKRSSKSSGFLEVALSPSTSPILFLFKAKPETTQKDYFFYFACRLGMCGDLLFHRTSKLSDTSFKILNPPAQMGERVLGFPFPWAPSDGQF